MHSRGILKKKHEHFFRWNKCKCKCN